MSIDLVLLAGGIAPDTLTDKGCKAWPPELRSDELVSLQDTRMTSRGVVMMVRDDRATKVSICGNIDVALVGQDVSIIVPIR